MVVLIITLVKILFDIAVVGVGLGILAFICWIAFLLVIKTLIRIL